MPVTGRPRAVHISTSDIAARGLVACLNEAGFDAVHAEGGSEAGLAVVENIHPDLVLIGTLNPEPAHRPFTLCREIAGRWPECRIVLIQIEGDDDLIRADAAIVGADACLSSTVPAGDLVSTCRSILALASAPSGRNLDLSTLTLDGLTPRQLAVLRLAAEGMTSSEIANELGISLNTVRSHERAIREKLHVTSIPAAIERASRLGII